MNKTAYLVTLVEQALVLARTRPDITPEMEEEIAEIERMLNFLQTIDCASKGRATK